MRDKGTPAELERRRLLAVRRVQEGYSVEEVADLAAAGNDQEFLRNLRHNLFANN